MVIHSIVVLDLYALLVILGLVQCRVAQHRAGECSLSEIQTCVDETEASRLMNEWVSYDGNLSVECNTASLSEGRACLQSITDSCMSVSDRKLRNAFSMFRMAQTTWEYVCENREGVIAGADCWREARALFQSGYRPPRSCDLCDMPRCSHDEILELPACTEESTLLLENLYKRILEEGANCRYN